jgi:hypothetical protein
MCYAQRGKTLNERKNIQNVLWQYKISHDTKFRVVALLILQQRVLMFFSLTERFPSLSVTYTLYMDEIFIGEFAS